MIPFQTSIFGGILTLQRALEGVDILLYNIFIYTVCPYVYFNGHQSRVLSLPPCFGLSEKRARGNMAMMFTRFDARHQHIKYILSRKQPTHCKCPGYSSVLVFGVFCRRKKDLKKRSSSQFMVTGTKNSTLCSSSL